MPPLPHSSYVIFISRALYRQLPPSLLVDRDKVERGEPICETLEEAADKELLEIAISSKEVGTRCIKYDCSTIVDVLLYNMNTRRDSACTIGLFRYCRAFCPSGAQYLSIVEVDLHSKAGLAQLRGGQNSCDWRKSFVANVGLLLVLCMRPYKFFSAKLATWYIPSCPLRFLLDFCTCNECRW